jgi:hypothetical protein
MSRVVYLVACALLLVAFPAVSYADDSGLLVESLQWKPGERGGGILELRYKLVGVDELPRHPSVTYVADPESGQRVQIQRPVMLPSSAADAASAPAAMLVLTDEANRIPPGSRVTVVVAGLVREDVLVERGEVTPEEATDSSSMPRPDTVPLDATLEVVKLRVSGGGYLLDIRYHFSGAGMVLADEGTTYVELPATGERLYVLGVARIGTLATKDAGPGKTSFLLIQNPDRKVKPGARVHVVIAGIRADNVLVE